ncbi:hypothetical protein [Thalassomonas actiniarum]|uniref:DUF5610 domain-containing protein n=1 Tax=Thalassomonas actiniarum TaxID=485447 RepID=A0AAF0C520_9GAMM|nr:hypothetical protein [Thalassomonas actiniarum]WDE00405.1 hypothetical protein SG35_007130 [Thalassomonas actiniarum]
MLTSINAYTTQTANNRLDTVNSTAESTASAGTVREESAAAAGNNLFLSSKAEKINAISAEFFKKGPLTSVDVDKLVERAYEYGLISKAEYGNLAKTAQGEQSQEGETQTVTASLAGFIEDFQQRFNSVDADEQNGENSRTEPTDTEIEMNKALSSAQAILSDVEQAKKADNFQQSLSHAIATLTEVVQSESFSQLPLDDRVGLSKSVQALEVVDKLTPQKQSNKFINRYLDIFAK